MDSRHKVAVGTTGKILQQMRKNDPYFKKVNYFVIDEIHHLDKEPFMEELIIRAFSYNCKIILLSATSVTSIHNSF